MGRHTLVRMAAVSIAALTPFIIGAQPRLVGRQSGSNPDGETQARVLELFSASPAVFIENTGQIEDPSVRYIFKGNGANVYHTTGGVVFELFEVDKEAGKGQGGDTLGNDPRMNSGAKHLEVQRRRCGIGVRFEGAKVVEPKGAQGQGTKVNYYSGNDPNKWRTNVATYAEVVYPGIYEGMDLHTFGRRSHLKYEFHIRPGADYSQIVIRYEGIEGLSIDAEGKLHIQTPLGELIDDAPVIYQVINGKKFEIAGRYRLIDKTSYTFEIAGQIDASRELIIDPDLSWASYLGGSGEDEGYGVAVDNSGNVFLTGSTHSTNFPVSGGFDTSYNGGLTDAFIVKVIHSGELSWATFLGGGAIDYGDAISVDSNGDALITGRTYSDNFPVPGGFDTSHNGSCDVFVAKMTEQGELHWASYLGGGNEDYGYGCAVGLGGDVMITGQTWSSNFPASGSFDMSFNGGYTDAFVAKVSNSGEIVWASFLGGNNQDCGKGIAVDSGGNALITGWTLSGNFPTPNGFDVVHNGESDVFVVKVTSSGELSWGSFLGGRDRDIGYSIAVDSNGDALITGQTESRSNFPVVAGFDTSFNGGMSDGFVAKVTNTGVFCWATFIGGNSDDFAEGIAADSNRNAVVTGWTRSTNFPTPRGFDTSYNGVADIFVVKVTNTGGLSWASYLGGSDGDFAFDVSVDFFGNVLLSGNTKSADFPIAGGFDTSYNGERDAFVAKIDVNGLGTGDVSRDGYVDFEDFARMGEWWMEACGSPDWCEGSDVDGSGAVDLNDFEAIARQWVQETY